MSEEKVRVELVEANALTRWPCHVCGGHTEKHGVLAEVTEGYYRGLRVCEQCLEQRNFDDRIESHIQSLNARIRDLEAEKRDLQAIKGRLVVPTFEQWQEAEREHDRKVAISHGVDPDAREEVDNKAELPF